jgi:hypothetical protein
MIIFHKGYYLQLLCIRRIFLSGFSVHLIANPLGLGFLQFSSGLPGIGGIVH